MLLTHTWEDVEGGCIHRMAAATRTMELMEKSGVIVTPGASFGKLGEGYVRMALVLPPEKMKAAAEAIRLSKIL